MSADKFADYWFLHQLSSFCAIHFPGIKAQEILQEVGDAYQANSFYEKNAIENEFLFPLVQQLGAARLKRNTQFFPPPLKTICDEFLTNETI